MRAKICGIRSEADLRTAIRAGADAVGFICGVTHFSEDALEEEQARRLSSLTPPFVDRILVTHLVKPESIARLADSIRADTIQIHGLVTQDTVRRVRQLARGRRIIKAVHVTGADAVEAACETAADCDAVLLDSRTTNRLGGTGLTHDWTISAAIVRALADLGRPVILAGGLTPANVTAAIGAVAPYAVDVNSGVETPTGDKDAARCTAFAAAAHRVPTPFELPVRQR
ncbi:phosphoribosylanthranilate isomerase [Nocardia aurantia]|uniref:N-(5'-phosphoribosyl)anthranilate isomerase n=1 Tax=Nocardia aurantia TaxID=2585199 RepID=A0A7K0E0I2_9NOCA|nr:phosphoribosylanthranilate isomerase [Nocardia aurantia]MQY31391.1 N-(5'-phosphoribosyl)anthranilate isomerase [Nocardia aurantia]